LASLVPPFLTRISFAVAILDFFENIVQHVDSTLSFSKNGHCTFIAENGEVELQCHMRKLEENPSTRITKAVNSFYVSSYLWQILRVISTTTLFA
jgi:hypothetical protein